MVCRVITWHLHVTVSSYSNTLQQRNKQKRNGRVLAVCLQAVVLAVCLQAQQSAKRCCIIYYTQTLVSVTVWESSPSSASCAAVLWGGWTPHEGISMLHINSRWSKAHLIDVARSALGLEDVMPQPMPCFFWWFVLRNVDRTRLNIEA